MRLISLVLATSVLGMGGLLSRAEAQTADAQTLESAIAQANSQTPGSTDALNYDEYMSLGYNAQQEGRYYEAAQYFRYALYANPEDRAAVVAYWNARDALQEDATEAALTFDQYMNRGYDETEAGNYRTALENFRQAYAIRPGNYYANQAILNVQTYLESEAVVQSPNASVATPPPYIEAPSIPTDAYLGESPYDRYMRLGYASLQEEAFTTAADYFRSALYERPEDRWATIAYWNAVDGLQDGEAGLGGENQQDRYDHWMRLGYDATQREAYQAAISFFQRALELRPQDYYAREALENVRTYLTE